MKFKVGDKVVTVKQAKEFEKGAYGVVVKAVKVDHCMYLVSFYSGEYTQMVHRTLDTALGQWWVDESEIEFVKQETFSQAEIQQLRSILSANISKLDALAQLYKHDAKSMKEYWEKEEIDGLWKSYFSARSKIKKLSALQKKLKSVNSL